MVRRSATSISSAKPLVNDSIVDLNACIDFGIDHTHLATVDVGLGTEGAHGESFATLEVAAAATSEDVATSSHSNLIMEQLKGIADNDPIGRFLFARWPRLRRLWTKADFLHAHAVSGVIFIPGATIWLMLRIIDDFAGGTAEGFLGTDSPLSLLLCFSGVVNALTAIPMARFSSDKLMDLSDLKANGFSLGGTGLTCMCAWLAWWFSGVYPSLLHTADATLVVLASLLCIATTVNWEVMVQMNFEGDGAEQLISSAEKIAMESNGKIDGSRIQGRTKQNVRQERKFAAVLKDHEKRAASTVQEGDSEISAAMAATIVARTKLVIEQKKWLYRVASWPNLTQILFMSSIALGGENWLTSVDAAYPEQSRMLYDYSFASMLGYSLSMFAETLRDRKFIGLELDFVALLIGVLGPMGVVGLDAIASGSAAQINPAEYWAIFGKL